MFFIVPATPRYLPANHPATHPATIPATPHLPRSSIPSPRSSPLHPHYCIPHH
ncbi:hypothetical protein BDN70DRAFT_874533 [Pholiota conissans]|uniref:Uncharacterized protein n=1 Tax=Pholiota conissans TaxID=109636 RepID=A0A9P6D4L4_9AGAR|nr:hypothetical protein BDN70DRAFT_874533 [Pholiota conissans]